MLSANKIIIMCLISKVSSGFSMEIFVFVVFENSPQTTSMLEEELLFPEVWLSASVERMWERMEKLLHLSTPGWQIFPRTVAGREQMQATRNYNTRGVSSFLLLFWNCQVLNDASDKCVMGKYWKLYIPIITRYIYIYPHYPAFRILVPLPGIESGPLAVKAPSFNHWTTREFPMEYF